MTITQLYERWAEDFERCMQDDRWERLGGLVTDGVIYRVVGAPFATKLVGKDALLAGLRRSVDHFDRRLDARSVRVIKTRIDHDEQLTAELLARYERHGAPPLEFTTIEIVRSEGDEISEIVDIYEPDLEETKAALAWLGIHGPDLDPRYQDG